jgi:hypothetical protein
MEKNVSSSDSEVDIEVKHVDTHVGSPIPEEIDPVAERKLVRKLDLILLPMFGLICKFMHGLCQWDTLSKCVVSTDCVNLIDRRVRFEKNIFLR